MTVFLLSCFSSQAFSCGYISFKVKGETAKEKVGPYINYGNKKKPFF